MSTLSSALRIESLLLANSSSATPSQHIRQVRKLLIDLVTQLLGKPVNSLHSVTAAIQAASRSDLDRRTLREIGIWLLRLMSQPGLLPSNEEENQSERVIVDYLESHTPDIVDRYVKDKKELTFKKLRALSTVHAEVCQQIDQLRRLPNSPETFLASRQDVLKSIKTQQAVAYLSIFDIKGIATNVSAMYDLVDALRTTIDQDYWNRLDDARAIVAGQRVWIEQNPSFLTKEYYAPFLSCVSEVLAAIDRDARTRFKCEIRSRTSDSFILDRRMPLHDNKKIVQFQIPLVNDGPGLAVNVSVSLESTDTTIEWGASSIPLGDIRPGGFAFTIEAMIGTPRSELSIPFRITWGNLADGERKQRSMIAMVMAQSPSTDWATLERREPYSTAIAEGSEFVGRQEKIAALSGRILKDRMQSSYITGQKRIGKSSLAQAVIDRISESPDRDNIHFIYLEYGSYSHKQPDEIVATLGLRIQNFLQEHLPPSAVISQTRADYLGTLAPLCVICDKLAKLAPKKKFVVVLDEFDEIPPELYRVGPLAEAFFSNLRTLSSKKNLAFMLVGGENMPFVVSAQGDQLNKFVREGLNYFSKTDEWADFSLLVTKPVADQLHWHPSAITSVYDLSNGHPYYAKIICAKVYSTAVSERDTEITASEVQRAYSELVSSLDVNSFAHLWKDGIQAARDEAEVISLQRCRVLRAVGRTLRQKKPFTLEALKENRQSMKIMAHEFEPIVTDFCKRGILTDQGGTYEFILPLFRDWLTQSGLNNIVADTLGDDISVSLQQAEEKAYVKDSEIIALTESWPPYRGQKIEVAAVRDWLSQRDKSVEQRLLFKLLQNIYFVSEFDIRSKMKTAHGLVLQSLPEPPPVRRSQNERRSDIIVTYVDGAAKSGHYYAARYAEENIISSTCVKEMSQFSAALSAHEEEANVTINGVVVVDDLAGTGRSLAENIRDFVAKNGPALRDRNARLIVVLLCAAPEGARRIDNVLKQLDGIEAHLRVCEPLGPSHFAFGSNNKIWDTQTEAEEAKSLCLELGSKLSKNAALGFGQQGLLVVFPNTCPNNTLPILHQAQAGRDGWRALFPRPKN